MNLFEDIRTAVGGLRSNKMRSFLTMLGIIIGISSVIMITTMGTMVQNTFTHLIEDIGMTNMVEVDFSIRDDVPNPEGPFYPDDTDLLSEDLIRNVQKHFAKKIKYLGLSEDVGEGTIRQSHTGLMSENDINLDIMGFNHDELEMGNGTKLIAGRYISQKDCDKVRQVINIPLEMAEKMFGSAEAALGQTIDITRYEDESDVVLDVHEYTVVGVWDYIDAAKAGLVQVDRHNPFSTTYTVYVPLTTARYMDKIIGLLRPTVTVQNGLYDHFMMVATDDVSPTDFVNEVVDYINETYYKDNPTYDATGSSAKEQLDDVNSALGVVGAILGIIAGISLLVGGIGVMNIMLVSVSERTKEIGVRKAIGATNAAIRAQFIVESAIICLIGGVTGILLGAGLVTLIAFVANTFFSSLLAGLTITATISPVAVIGSVIFSMAVGVFFGAYPAAKAAKLAPIEALRYD
jgi:putative ABC transport system permease protein